MLQQHFVHLDLELVGLVVHRPHQAGGLGPLETAPAHAVVDGLPGVNQHRVLAADVFQGGAAHRVGDRGQPGKPLLLEAPDEGLVIPAQVGHHDHIAPGDVAAGVAVPLHEHNVFTARPGGGDGSGVARRAAAYHQDVTFVVNLDGLGGFCIGFFHRIAPL